MNEQKKLEVQVWNNAGTIGVQKLLYTLFTLGHLCCTFNSSSDLSNMWSLYTLVLLRTVKLSQQIGAAEGHGGQLLLVVPRPLGPTILRQTTDRMSKFHFSLPEVLVLNDISISSRERPFVSITKLYAKKAVNKEIPAKPA